MSLKGFSVKSKAEVLAVSAVRRLIFQNVKLATGNRLSVTDKNVGAKNGNRCSSVYNGKHYSYIKSILNVIAHSNDK